MKHHWFFDASASVLDLWRKIIQAPALLGYELIYEESQVQWPPDRTARRFLYEHRYSVPIPIEPREIDDPSNDPIKIIRMRAKRHDTKQQIRCQIGINLSACALDRATTSWWLLRPLPADGLIWKVARTSVWLLALQAERTYKDLEETTRLSRHGWMVMEALKDQLDDVTLSQLRLALRDDWFRKPEIPPSASLVPKIETDDAALKFTLSDQPTLKTRASKARPYPK